MTSKAAVAAATTAVFVGAMAVLMRPPAVTTSPVRGAELDPSPEGCKRCHAEIVDAWRGSMHAQAWTNPVFRAEYDPAPKDSCRACHAPPNGSVDAHGVDCASCHVRGQTILGTRSSEAGRAAHPVRIDGGLSSPARCGTCHQFDHADDGVHDPTEPLQATLDEWRKSDAFREGTTCVDCHMGLGAGGRGHEFVGLGSPDLLASAVDVSVRPRRTADGSLSVDVELTGAVIGHSFPTGDVFRRGVLRLWTAGGSEASISMQRWLARTADPDGLDTHVRTVDDTRVPPPGDGQLTEQLALDDTSADWVNWTLEIHRLDLVVADQRGIAHEDAVVVVLSGRARVPPRMP